MLLRKITVCHEPSSMLLMRTTVTWLRGKLNRTLDFGWSSEVLLSLQRRNTGVHPARDRSIVLKRWNEFPSRGGDLHIRFQNFCLSSWFDRSNLARGINQ